MSVEVLKDGRMIFLLRWTYTNDKYSRNITRLTLESYVPARLLDNLGNYYEMVDVGGEITGVFYLTKGTLIVTGWYEFPAPDKNASSFTFIVMNKIPDGSFHTKYELERIVLDHPVIINETLELQVFPLLLDYKVAIWEPGMTADEEVMLSHKTIPGCQVTEWKTSEPQGELKNTVTLGTLTYEIYGWIESENNLGYREYLLIAGLVGLDSQEKPLFRAAIPLDQSEPCIYAASDLLKGLRPAD